MDVVEFTKGYDECQWTLVPSQGNEITCPLTSIIANQPFEKWGIDFIGLISPIAKNTQAIVPSEPRLEPCVRLMLVPLPNLYMSK